jgi:hypothetical protein
MGGAIVKCLITKLLRVGMPIVFYHMSPANGIKADRTKRKLIFTQIPKYDLRYRHRNTK